ncbi:Uncharacterised protein [Chromobacterium violaceum]|uniref:Uncharacterized protein n=1 Tax=Chromobacterium violaceum TaxID=536 RepID=A0A447TIR1_CHRVL|nr:Uncharacterised protein [Chromobacterium violaceum]
MKFNKLNVKELSEATSAGEREWLGTVKGKALEDSLEIRAELPQWVIERLANRSRPRWKRWPGPDGHGAAGFARQHAENEA